MNYEDINYNEIIISGFINNITDTNDKYIKFSIVSKKYNGNEDKKVYVSLNISRELYNIYQDCFVKENKVFIKGYLNSYIDRNKDIKLFISVSDISNNPNIIRNGKNKSYIRYDPDDVMVWNGKRCESKEPTDEELEEMGNLLSEFN